MKSIGVDYGLVRTGLAVSMGYNAVGLDVIVTGHPLLREDEIETNYESDADEAKKEEERRLDIQRSEVSKKVVEAAVRERANRIVVGLPLHKNGTEAVQTKLVRNFVCDHLAVDTLRALGPDVQVYLFDERYTSKEASARIRSKTKSHRNDLYGLLDTESAKIILEQYYNDHSIYDTTKINQACYQGELVTIDDNNKIQELTKEYNSKRRQEQQKLAEELSDREDRIKWRKLAMERDRAIDGINKSKKGKKIRKKRKRK